MTLIPEKLLKFIEELPKAELHVHLESTAIPETLLKLAEENNVDYPFKTVEEINEAFDSRTVGLKSFLDVHYKVFSVIKTRDDFRKVTYDFLRTCKENNVLYVEMMFDPQVHTNQGIEFEDVIKGIDYGRKTGLRDFGVESNLIMCIYRDRTVECA